MNKVKYYEVRVDGTPRACIPNDNHTENVLTYTKILYPSSEVTSVPLVELKKGGFRPAGEFEAAQDIIKELMEEKEKLEDILRLAAMSARTLRTDDKGLSNHCGFGCDLIMAMEECTGLDGKTGYGADSQPSQSSVLDKYGYI